MRFDNSDQDWVAFKQLQADKLKQSAFKELQAFKARCAAFKGASESAKKEVLKYYMADGANDASEAMNGMLTSDEWQRFGDCNYCRVWGALGCGEVVRATLEKGGCPMDHIPDNEAVAMGWLKAYVQIMEKVKDLGDNAVLVEPWPDDAVLVGPWSWLEGLELVESWQPAA